MKIKSLRFIILLIGVCLLLSSCNLPVLYPKGTVGIQERNLIITATLLMLIVVIPVIVLTLTFAYKYRATNLKAKYTPEWDYNIKLEIFWWIIPCIIVIILATITWKTTHELDPYKPLDVKGKPITVQVIALDWKWLFIYPDENIATVNYLQFPEDTPINFKITADAPMNSFWIPELGGQIYAMAGMQTKLHLISNHIGEYKGLSASFSGPGFSDMRFLVKVSTREDFNKWVNLVRTSPNKLDQANYDRLIKPTENHKREYFSTVENKLYDYSIMKYMMPEVKTVKDMQHMHHMHMHMM